ncbi:hypothetical protein [Frigoriflavimonas asaccharolytica]|uniref:Uncharacterized protein n=1 Tax=Frigoriflavimonas asaccharolytica TaxID=2735899 RepID=A0A8J8KA96_9FLAO|nr:hypothetical protein [Frigoriflavimonas asaccharolytica]NRS93932.1 hypothetical protein [Frigoriflavimonas asaccharolytica]
MKKIVFTIIILISNLLFSQNFEKRAKYLDSIKKNTDTLVIISTFAGNPWYNKEKKDLIIKSKKIGTYTTYTFSKEFSFVSENKLGKKLIYRFVHYDINDEHMDEYKNKSDSLRKNLIASFRYESLKKNVFVCGNPLGEIKIHYKEIDKKYPAIDPFHQVAEGYIERNRIYPYKLAFDFDIVFFLPEKTKYFIYDKGNKDGMVTFKEVEVIYSL